MVITSRQERQDQERVAGPAGSLLYVAALRQPRLGLGLVVALDGEGGETFIARHEELRLEGGLQTARDPRGPGLQVAVPRDGDAERVVGVRDDVGGLQRLAEGQGAARPLRRLAVLAETEVDAGKLVVEPGRLEVLGV